MLKTLVGLAGFASLFAATQALAAGPDLEAAKAVIEAHSGIPEFTPPGPPFNARDCMKGKRLLSIPTSSAIPFVDGIETNMANVAKEVGFTFQQWKNQGQPTQWVQGMDFAVNGKFDAVDLFAGIIPASLAPQVAAANKAGVKVLASHYSDTETPADPGVAVTLKLPFHEVGQIIADWITLKTGGKANVLIIGSDDILATKPYVKALTDTLEKNCGAGCKYRYVGVTVPEWSTKVQNVSQSALIADPTINYIVPIYDSMAQFVLPALTITGHRKDVKIATFNGTPFILDMLRKGDVEMDVGESLGWIARSTMDGYMRGLCGLPTYDALNVPLYIFSDANVKSAGIPAEFDKGYGDKQVAGFAKLWELQ
jgi:ribose transport system substrate-binding protein